MCIEGYYEIYVVLVVYNVFGFFGGVGGVNDCYGIGVISCMYFELGCIDWGFKYCVKGYYWCVFNVLCLDNVVFECIGGCDQECRIVIV